MTFKNEILIPNPVLDFLMQTGNYTVKEFKIITFILLQEILQYHPDPVEFIEKLIILLKEYDSEEKEKAK